MYRIIATIEGIAPLSQSRFHNIPKQDRESSEDHEARTWREKCNCDENGIVYVPAMALKQAMDVAAKRLAIPDPDNKRATLSKFFVSDVICEGNLSIGVHKDEMPAINVYANVDGVRGSGKRVMRRFPQITKWGGTTSFLVMDEKIKPDIFERVLEAAGRSVGVGQFRAEKGGLNGRFRLVKTKVEQV